MLNINNINENRNIYKSSKKNISFQSKFVPNFALKTAFENAKKDIDVALFRSTSNLEYRELGIADEYLCKCRNFANIIRHLLNDGKDDVIKVEMSKKNNSSALFINSKKVNMNNGSCYKFYKDLPMENIIDYFSYNIPDKTNLSGEELKLIQQNINSLNSDLNADDITKNSAILNNLNNNIAKIYNTLARYTMRQLEGLETEIFKNTIK